ncbi:MAG: FAD binding domain-containing protein [Clostridiales bacterium]|nr:FAD binding domain-containing protein [Clostridiales bacterium]
MRKFNYVDAATIEDAASALSGGGALAIAGGTDLLCVLKDDILPDYPETLVNLKRIPGLDHIREEDGMLRIGALARIADIAGSAVIRERYTALAEAAGRVGSPQLRDMGTIGGNICQLPRCWYYRCPGNRFHCARKGGETCNAAKGEGRYHSVFGGVNGCFAVNASDLAPALVSLGATVRTSSRSLGIEDFFSAGDNKTTVLSAGEIVTEVLIPVPASGTKSAFTKYAQRKSIDFPIVNCAAVISGGGARICLNAVYATPYRAKAAEGAIAGKPINEANAEAAGEEAVSGAKALELSRYKVEIAKAMVKRAIMACV